MTQESIPEHRNVMSLARNEADASAETIPSIAGSCEQSVATVDRRDRGDRRGSVWRAFMYGNFRPRRRSSRRAADAHYFWFDWHEPRVLYLTLAILLLSCTDALFTLNLLEAGAAEANQVMQTMLNIGIERFVIVKISLTAFCLVLLVIVARRKVIGSFSVEHVLQTLLAGYLLLICYELYMFWFVFELSVAPRWLLEWLGAFQQSITH